MATTGRAGLSARNQFTGTVREIQHGEAMSVVTVLVGDIRIVAAVTTDAVQELGLTPQDRVTAIVKATEPILIKGEEGQSQLSARNKLPAVSLGCSKGRP